jgi:hypothetical protein
MALFKIEVIYRGASISPTFIGYESSTWSYWEHLLGTHLEHGQPFGNFIKDTLGMANPMKIHFTILKIME